MIDSRVGVPQGINIPLGLRDIGHLTCDSLYIQITGNEKEYHQSLNPSIINTRLIGVKCYINCNIDMEIIYSPIQRFR